MTAKDACALLRLQLRPQQPMVRVCRTSQALLVCDARVQARTARALGWEACSQGEILLVDLPECAYLALSKRRPEHARDAFVEPWMEAQALLSSLVDRELPWRGPVSASIMRTAMQALSGTDADFFAFLAFLRRQAALTMRQGGDMGVTGAARLAAESLWNVHGIGLPAKSFSASFSCPW